MAIQENGALYSGTGLAPHKEDFQSQEEFNAAYLMYLQTTFNLERGDRVLTTISACLNNPSRWNQGSDRARGG